MCNYYLLYFLLFKISNIQPGCYIWYQSFVFKRFLGTLGSELIMFDLRN